MSADGFGTSKGGSADWARQFPYPLIIDPGPIADTPDTLSFADWIEGASSERWQVASLDGSRLH